jgi:N-carbamoylputrescine amidase
MNNANVVKAAGIQLSPTRDRDSSVKRAVKLIELASENGAKLISLPQLFNAHWFARSIDNKNFELAETIDGPSLTAVRGAAARAGSVVIAPIFERDGSEHFNTAFVIGPAGEIIGRYRKVHVPQIPLWEERSYFKPGDLGFPVIETPFAKVGVQLCWDTFFPEGFRILGIKGAEIVFVPTASAFLHSKGKWERALSAAAHANGYFVFRVNRVGMEEKQEFYGRSFCVGPDGEFLAEPGGNGEGVVLASIDLAETTRIRNDWVFMRDRRPELYGDITKERT